MPQMSGSDDRCRVYLITPPKLDPVPFADLLAAALDAGDVAAVQLRLKEVGEDDWKHATDTLRPVAQSRDVAFLLNDRAELVREFGCDGVHVGQEDMPYKEARVIVGRDAVVGVTCHDSRHLAMEAAEAGADYVAFGAFFPTSTKEAKTNADIELLRWWSELMVVPCVAIGGITAENCAPLVRAGADFLAVVGCIWSHPDGPAVGVRALNAAIAQAR